MSSISARHSRACRSVEGKCICQPTYQVRVRLSGRSPLYGTFESLIEAEDWAEAAETEEREVVEYESQLARREREVARRVLRDRIPWDSHITHGATSALMVTERARQVGEDLRDLVPGLCETDEPTLRLAAVVVARIELVSVWLETHGLFNEQGDPHPILDHLGRWEATAARLFSQLGLSPLSRAEIGARIATMARAEAAL